MNYKTELGEKQTILSIENKDEVLTFNELRELLKSRAGKKERTISYLEEDITVLPQSKRYSRKQFLAQREETVELTIILKADIASGNNLKILLTKNQDKITRLIELKVRSKAFDKSIRRRDNDNDSDSTEVFNILKNTSPTNIFRDNNLYQVLKK